MCPEVDVWKEMRDTYMLYCSTSLPTFSLIYLSFSRMIEMVIRGEVLHFALLFTGRSISPDITCLHHYLCCAYGLSNFSTLYFTSLLTHMTQISSYIVVYVSV